MQPRVFSITSAHQQGIEVMQCEEESTILVYLSQLTSEEYNATNW
jgi:hypothetical protein